MRRLALLVSLILVVFHMPTTVAQSIPAPAIYSYDPALSICPRVDQSCQDWVTFRRGVAGPYQSFGIAKHGDRATVILSEPAANRDDLLALVDAVFGRGITRTYRRWTTGLDGWLEDLVLDVPVHGTASARVLSGHTLSRWEAPVALVDRLLFIYVALHGTSDGFYIDDVLNFTDARAAPPIFELQLSPDHLREWFEDASKDWREIGGGSETIKVAALQAARRPAAYARADGTLVALAVPPKTILSDVSVPFRRFAVASDVLLAAYRTKTGTTVLFGRARQLPLTLLPPLRFETFSTFVRYRTTELAQSYERQRIFAGRVQAGPFAGWDWAPILLSSQLDDSEFGTLLNQADQILKSWSQAGSVKYYAFAHRIPETFPFGDETASEYFEYELGTTSLVFNWNTQNLTTIYQKDGSELLTVDRYGALPILYMPSSRFGNGSASAPGAVNPSKKLEDARERKLVEEVSREAAEDARDYFSEDGDPILVRVVQNVLLYQVAQAYLQGLAPTEMPGPARWNTVSGVLREEATRWLQAVSARGSTPAVTPATKSALDQLTREKSLTIPQLAELIATPQATVARLTAARARYLYKYEAARQLLLELDKLGPEYDRAFYAFCKAVNGTVTKPDPLIDGSSNGVLCKYTRGTPPPEETYYIALDKEYRAKDKELDAAEKEGQQARTEFETLAATYAEADTLARTLAREASLTAALDRVLERVRLEAAKSPSPGSIRTPVLVLSRNVDDVFAIGGHNINFEPNRVRVADLNASPVLKRPVPTVPRPPAPDAAAALRTSRSGTIANEMRATGRVPDARVPTDLFRRASACSCPAIEQTVDGQIRLVSPTPPPVAHILPGRLAIPDVLAGPPPVRAVLLEGFSQADVAYIMRTRTALLEAGTGPTPLRRWANAASRFFGETDANAGRTWFAYGKRSASGQAYSIALDPALKGSIRQPTLWSRAQVVPAAAGDSTAPLIIRFPNGRGPGVIEPVDIEIAVELPTGRVSGASPALRKTVQSSLSSATPPRAPFEDGLEDLHRAITRTMTDAEIAFFVKQIPRVVNVQPSNPGLHTE